MKPDRLYIHFPFCAYRCGYCDYPVWKTRRPPVDAWLDAIVTELQLASRANGWRLPLELETVYVGGGTPSHGGAHLMGDLRQRLKGLAEWDGGVAEWTAEANPEDVDRSLAVAWREAGVNRVSLGVQSFDDGVLRWLGRRHSGAVALEAVDLLRDAGFRNLNLDLVYGLPDYFDGSRQHDLEKAICLGPEHMALYGLTGEWAVTPGSGGTGGVARPVSDDDCAEQYLDAARSLVAAGYRHYEVSSFCRDGHVGRHTSSYWNGSPYLGLGPGAHSYQPPFRYWNVARWDAYSTALSGLGSVRGGHEEVSGHAARLERVWSALCVDEGLPAEELGPAALSLVDRWRGNGLVRVGEPIRLTPRGWLLLDRLVVELDAVQQEC